MSEMIRRYGAAQYCLTWNGTVRIAELFHQGCGVLTPAGRSQALKKAALSAAEIAEVCARLQGTFLARIQSLELAVDDAKSDARGEITPEFIAQTVVTASDDWSDPAVIAELRQQFDSVTKESYAELKAVWQAAREKLDGPCHDLVEGGNENSKVEERNGTVKIVS